MRLLLDTHALLWALMDPEKLDKKTRAAIISPENLVYASLASLWELQIKNSIGKVNLPDIFLESLTDAGFELLPIMLPHVQSLQRLPMLHRDPFDRMLIAQAESESLTLATRDRAILQYKGNFLKV